MDVRTILIVLLFILFLSTLTIAGYLFLQLESQEPQITLPVLPTPIVQEPVRESESLRVSSNVFYLTNDYTQLESEKRMIPNSDSLAERIHSVLKELMRKPISTNLINPIPEGTEVQNVFWNEEEGRAYISFSKELFRANDIHSLDEWAIIYSIVNTVAEQSPRIKNVQLLLEGQIIENSYLTWDWSLPFSPDKTFVRYTLPENL